MHLTLPANFKLPAISPHLILINAIIFLIVVVSIAQEQNISREIYSDRSLVNVVSHMVFGDELSVEYSLGVKDKFLMDGFTDQSINYISENENLGFKKMPVPTEHDIGYDLFVFAAVKIMGLSVTAPFWLFVSALVLSFNAILLLPKANMEFQIGLIILAFGLLLYTYALPSSTQLSHLGGGRSITVLSLPATYFIVYFALRGLQCFDSRTVLSLIFSVVLISCVILLRSTAIWQGLCVFVVVFYRLLMCTRGLERQKFLPWLFLLIAIPTLFSGVKLQFGSAQNNTASTRSPHHIFWHNVGIGFSLNDYFFGSYIPKENRLKDDFMYLITDQQRFVASGKERCGDAGSQAKVDCIEPMKNMVLNGLSPETVSILEHESKKFVLSNILSEPLETIKLFVFHKTYYFFYDITVLAFPPLFYIGEKVANYFSLEIFRPDESGPQRHTAYYMERLVDGFVLSIFRIPAFLLLLLFAKYVMVNQGIKFGKALPITFSLMFVFSAMPAYVAYPELHTIGPSVVLLMVVFGLIVVNGAQKYINNTMKQPHHNARQPDGTDGRRLSALIWYIKKLTVNQIVLFCGIIFLSYSFALLFLETPFLKLL